MVIDIQSPFFLDAKNVAANEEGTTLEGIEIRHYDNLVNDISKRLIPLAGRNKYMLIKFPINEVPNSASTIFYELQLLGFTPIILNADRNIEVRRNPNKLYTLVAKGALVQIDASSLTGENGRLIRKFAVRLCKHNLVHVVSSDAYRLVKTPFLFKRISKYSTKKFFNDYANYLQSNAKQIRKGSDFHTRIPIKFK